MNTEAMRGKYRSYPEYKKTHLGWLSQIPSHWEVKRLKYLGDALIGLTYSPDQVVDEEEGILVLRSSNVQNRQLAFDDNVYVNKTIPEKLVTQKGDILICARNGSRALIGKNAQIDEGSAGMSFGAFMSIFRSPYNDYLSKVFNSPLFEYQSGSFLTATINQLTTGNLNSFEIPLPSESEREKIANFLDHETAKIDTLIEKQQQLIALLKEKRQAVISHAVTKGLNPNAPMKNSGVEWLGEVPEHWEVCRVKQITNFITSGPRGWSDYLSENGDDIFLQSGDLNNKLGLELSAAKKISPPSNAEGVRTKLKNGDVVVCITGANTGRVAITPNLNGTIYINQHLSLIRPIKRLIDTDYLGLVLSSSSVKSYFSVTQYGLKEGLSLSNVGEAPTCRPPLKEQKEIVKHVWNESDRYDALESYAGKQVALLRERRTALISAAVTGKIDVRNWVLPEEVENMDVALSSGLR